MINIQAVPLYFLFPCAFTVVINSQYLTENFVVFQQFIFLYVLASRLMLFHDRFTESSLLVYLGFSK